MEPVLFFSIQTVLLAAGLSLFLLGVHIGSRPANLDNFLFHNRLSTALVALGAVIMLCTLIIAITTFFVPLRMSHIVVEDEILGLPLLLAFRKRQLTPQGKRSLVTAAILFIAALLTIFSLFSCKPKATYEARLLESDGYHQRWECRTQPCVDSLYARSDVFVDSVDFVRSARRWLVWTSPLLSPKKYRKS